MVDRFDLSQRNEWQYRSVPGVPMLTAWNDKGEEVKNYGLTVYAYKARSEEEYLPYSAEMIESLPVGEYVLRVSVDESKNYLSASAETEFTVRKAVHDDVSTGPLSVVNGWRDLTVNLESLLEENFRCVVSDFEGDLFSGEPVTDGGVLRFDTTNSGQSGVVRITVSGDNYMDYTLTVTLKASSALTLRFDANGGDEITAVKSPRPGEVYGDLPVPIRPGYKFDGWYNAIKDGERVTASTVMGGVDVVLYAHWTKIDYTLTLLLRGGELPENAADWIVSDDSAALTFHADSEEFTLPEAVRDYYTFTGWTVPGQNQNTPVLELTIPKGTMDNLTFEANWTKGERTGIVEFIKADEDSGILGVLDLTRESAESDAQKSTTETDDEYPATSVAKTLKEIACADTTPLAENQTKDVIVSMNLRAVSDLTKTDNQELDAESRRIKSEQERIGDAVRQVFVGDNTVKSDYLSIDIEKTVTTITTDADGGEQRDGGVFSVMSVTPKTLEIPLRYNMTGRYNPIIFRFHDTSASALRRLASRPRDYQNLEGCFYVSGWGNDAVIYIYTSRFSSYSVTTSATESWTVFFETDGGTEISHQSVPLAGDKKVTRPADPVKAGYTFAGWYVLTDGAETPFDFDTDTVSGDITIYAKWTESAPMPTPRSGGGKIFPPPAISAGTSTPVPTSTPTPGDHYSVENPAPPDRTGVADWLITDTHPAYIQGFEDGTFRPNDNISRAQIAVLFYRMLKNPNIPRTTSFADMNGDEWYAKAVYTLSGMRIIQGYADGAFHGDDAISRAAFTAIATRFAKTTGLTISDYNTDFSDVPENYWARDSISRASFYGWIGGYADGSFRPSDPITRAAAVAVINRMLGRSADAAYITAHGDNLKRFSDVNDPNAWYYYNIAEAANTHGFTISDRKEIWRG